MCIVWNKRRKIVRWQKSASMVLNSAFVPLSSDPGFIQHHLNQHYCYITKFRLKICTRILLNGVEWPLRPGLRRKNIAEIASDWKCALLRLTGKTLGRDSPRLDIFLEIPSKQDIPFPKTVSSVSDHFQTALSSLFSLVPVQDSHSQACSASSPLGRLAP